MANHGSIHSEKGAAVAGFDPDGGLWLSAGRREALRAAGPVWWEACLRQMESQPMPEEAGPRLVRTGLRDWWRGDPVRLSEWAAWAETNQQSEDLIKADALLTGAVLADLVVAGSGWAGDDRVLWQEGMRNLLRAMRRPSPGNPHHAGNNWWAVTHAAGACAARQLARVDAGGGQDGRTWLEWVHWMEQRMAAYLDLVGETGAGHEGPGYQDYVMSYALPELMAEGRMAQSAGRWPWLGRLAWWYQIGAVEGGAWCDGAGGLAAPARWLSWNDSGPGWPDSVAPWLAVLWAPPAWQEALWAGCQRLTAWPAGQGKCSERFAGLFFAMAAFPIRLPDLQTDRDVLPLTLLDRRLGWWIARNRWLDSGDVVAGVYARTWHPGGHAHQDAGSLRFSALGHDWVVGGGQGRPEACWQSVVTPSDPRPAATAAGLMIWDEAHVAGVDLRRVHAGYSERYVALYDGAVPAVAVLDLIRDHRTDRHWLWNLTTAPDHQIEWLEEDAGFLLRAPDGVCARADFLLDRPKTLVRTRTPVARRQFVSGRQVEYVPRPVVQAVMGAGPLLRVLVVITVWRHKEEAVATGWAEEGGLRVGWARWERPFGRLFPEGWVGRGTEPQSVVPE